MNYDTTGEPPGITEHTGFPNPATDKTLTSLDINTLLIKHPASTFFMQIEGHNWEDYSIFDGDIAIIDRALSPQPQDIVVWWDGDNFRLRRYAKLPKNITFWGVISNIIHRYRP